MATLKPQAAVNPMRYSSDEVFSMDPRVNSLKIDFPSLVKDIERWTTIKISRKEGQTESTMSNNYVLDQLSTYLIDAFATLLQTYDPSPAQLSRNPYYRKPSPSDANRIMNIIKLRIRSAVDEMPRMEQTASYTPFFASLFSNSGKGARELLEALSPPAQCKAAMSNTMNSAAINHICWICAKRLDLSDASPECEHVLPVSDALFHLNLIQQSNREGLSKPEKDIQNLEYYWSHKCCNQVKNNQKFIRHKLVGGSEVGYEVSKQGIEKTLSDIRKASTKDLYDGDCKDLHSRSNILTEERKKGIYKIVEPIVETINHYIQYITRNAKKMDDHRRFIIYQYMIMIRFFSRIPGHAMIRAFQENFLSLDPDSIRNQKKQEENAQKEAEVKSLQKEADAIKSKIARLEEYPPVLPRLQEKWKNDIAQARAKLAEISKKMNMIQIGEQSGGLANDTNGTKHSAWYNAIQADHSKELQFILMLAYYPIYLQQHDVEEIDAKDYMTENVWKEVNAYFQVETTPVIQPLPVNMGSTQSANNTSFSTFLETYNPVYESNNNAVRGKTAQKRSAPNNWSSSNSNTNHRQIPPTPTRPVNIRTKKRKALPSRKLEFGSKSSHLNPFSQSLSTIQEGGKRSTKKRRTHKRRTHKRHSRR